MSKGKQSNDFNAPSTINILPLLFLVFLYFYDQSKQWKSSYDIKRHKSVILIVNFELIFQFNLILFWLWTWVIIAYWGKDGKFRICVNLAIKVTDWRNSIYHSLFKDCLHYKTITSQNVSSEAQIKNFFIS